MEERNKRSVILPFLAVIVAGIVMSGIWILPAKAVEKDMDSKMYRTVEHYTVWHDSRRYVVFESWSGDIEVLPDR